MNPGKIAIRCLKFVKDRNTFEVAKALINPPGEDEVLLRVVATSVNRVDILERRGIYKAVRDNDILGVEVVGFEVDPQNLEPVRPHPEFVGGIVRGGGYGEFIAIKKSHLIPFSFPLSNFLEVKRPEFPTPDALNFAAVPEAFLTAFQLLEFYGKPRQGEWVYIPAGSGGIGSAAIQLAKRLYGAKVITSCSTPEKMDICRRLGADVVLNYKDLEPKAFGEAIKKEVGEKGVHVILDCIGPSNGELHADIIGEDGRWVLFGLLGGQKFANENLMSQLLFKRVSLIGTLLRNRDTDYKANLVEQFNKRALPLFKDKRVLPVVGDYLVVNWNDPEASGMTKAHQIMEANQTMGRVIIGFDWTAKSNSQ